MLQSCRFTSWSARDWLRGGTTAPFASTATSASTAIPAQARLRSGAIGSPFWKTVRAERLVPDGALTEIWTSPPYNHCMFTSRPDLDVSLERRFAEALSGMSYDNPTHRAVF